jgi:hypothetical protein
MMAAHALVFVKEDDDEVLFECLKCGDLIAFAKPGQGSG